MINKFVSGIFKSPRDERDILVRSFFKKERKELPEAFSREDEMTPVRSQGNEGACGGYALSVGVKEWQERKEHKKFIKLSPRFSYEEAKKISGHKSGTTLTALAKVAHKFGVCEEKYWPYIAQNPGQPKPGAYENALKYQIGLWARMTDLYEVKVSLFDDDIGPLMIGVKVYAGMMSDNCRLTGVVPDPGCWERMKVLGGHALTVVSWKTDSPFFKNDGHVKVKNSWGKSYGDRGYLYLSYKYIKANMLDAIATVDIVAPENVERLGRRSEWDG